MHVAYTESQIKTWDLNVLKGQHGSDSTAPSWTETDIAEWERCSALAVLRELGQNQQPK